MNNPHTDGLPLDYVDDDGTQWVMCACGHRMGGSVKVGEKYDLCPSCKFTIRFGKIEVAYPDRLPDETMRQIQMNDGDGDNATD